jgi:hypothetical protein
VRSVAGLIRRRGTIIAWEPARPASGDVVHQDSREPRLTAGGARVATGPTGETYPFTYRVRGYFSKKTTAVFAQMWGLLDQRDAQLDIAVPFAPEPENGIIVPARSALDAWNRGAFAQFPPNAMPTEDLTLAARDRFTIAGTRYVVKSAAVPIQDNNITIAWRLLIGADTF